MVHLDRSAGEALLAGAESAGDGRLGTMQYLLILLVAVTLACGAAATVTIALAPAYADASAKGYYSEANP
ncbi:MAG: hypothetical protein JO136_11110 [Hyphomicrobiales bacterium]|nr:hypothetical protein [Hyphomicrobiales bacterium]MBV9909169.1 hypothetical protein [Hyphomicrobiales bacterium]